MTEQQVRKALIRSIGRLSQVEWARQNGVNKTVLCDVLGGSRAPTARMCELVGVHKKIVTTVRYERMK